MIKSISNVRKVFRDLFHLIISDFLVLYRVKQMRNINVLVSYVKKQTAKLHTFS